jgi:hypothetical protein
VTASISKCGFFYVGYLIHQVFHRSPAMERRMTTPPLTASVVATPPLTIDQFYKPAATPGNVGLCLSGGGTRACSAGMGQMRALATIQANGRSLLSQIKALSTVSGGSWLGVPYQYMPASGPTDAEYLGTYDADQGSLTLTDLASLPVGNAGRPMTSFVFSLEGIAGTAVLLYELFLKTSPNNPLPENMLWQMVMSLNILDSYNLLDLNTDGGQPRDMFSATAASLQAITTANSSLASATAYLFADQVDASRTQRPLHICNMGTFVNVPDISFGMLAPVQSNGLMTGVVGAPPKATDANGLKVGGGGVESFAFNSSFASQSAETATVTQTRQWSLTDIMGTSSAAFAETVQNQIKQWEANPWLFLKWLWDKGEDIVDWIESHLPFELHATAKALVARGTPIERDLIAIETLAAEAIAAAAIADIHFPDFDKLVPAYLSWPAGAGAPNATTNTFADGGSLENNGLASLLAFTDIDSVIVCVNSEMAMTAGTAGISDGNNGLVPGTKIVVDDSIPPLFGYQPYDSTNGYVLYSQGNSSPEHEIFSKSQVFASSEFAGFLIGLWEAAGKASPATQPAILSQSLVVQANPWFGVPAGSKSKPITIVWVYLNYASNWADLFATNPPVKQLVETEQSINGFPHYLTFSTQLSATQINLMAHFTSWSLVTADQDSGVFSNLFTA